MKNTLKIIFLYVLMFVIGIIILLLTEIKKELPVNIFDTNDMVINSLSKYPSNLMTYDGEFWTIEGNDPYIIVGNIGKYLHGIEIEVDDDNYYNFVVYYNTGKGFNQKQLIGLQKSGDGTYCGELRGNVFEIRIDIEKVPEGMKIPDMKISLYSGHDYFKKAIIRLLIYNIILAVLCSIMIFTEILRNKSSILIVSVKAVICAVVIGLSERTFFRITGRAAFFLFVFDALVVLTCIFFKAEYDTDLAVDLLDEVKEEAANE